MVDFPMQIVKTGATAPISKYAADALEGQTINRRYWENWAKDIAEIADRHQMRIRALLENPHSEGKKAFDDFLNGVRKNLNPSISQNDAIEMLALHTITKPVFDALFEGYAFTSKNPVSQSMQKIMDIIDAQALDKEHETLEGFYASVRERASGITDPKGRQKIIIELYEKFFKTAFPRMVERLGIVYTPVEIVDFILKSADAALRKHFGESLASPGVQILDPFAGTGTFLVRLIQSGLIDADKLTHKYDHELHANEIVLLAYYIATINIETAFHSVTGEYRPFDGMALVDTFQMTEEDDLADKAVLPENNSRVECHLKQPIMVIVGNPPYSAQQDSENDNNKKRAYPTLDKSIRESYAARSSAKLRKNLYDSYIRAIRWATNRICERGVVAFVTNGSFIDANNMDGLRKCLIEDFSHLYVFNLRGNQRTSGEESKREGGKIFGSGSRTPVAITIMVKDPAHIGPGELFYYDIGDYLSREEKLNIIEGFDSIDGIDWQRLHPNDSGDWINQRDPAFDNFIPLGDKDSEDAKAIFGIYSQGLLSARDAWAYNMSRTALEDNMRRMIAAFNEDRARYRKACEGKPKDEWPKVEQIINNDPKRISWTHNLKEDVRRGKEHDFEADSVTHSTYRPYSKQWLYFNRRFNERVYQQPKLFPSPKHVNTVISAAGVGANKAFSALVCGAIPDYELVSKGQCFPLYWYQKADDETALQGEMFVGTDVPDADGYIRRDAITDWSLAAFRAHYKDDAISKEDIFWYVYGILHSPEYKQRFATNLKKMLPRIPFAPDFKAFSRAGRKLAYLHLNYETVEPWPVQEDAKPKGDLNDLDYYRVEKMRFASLGGRNKDKSVIIFNSHITLRGIPLQAYDYVVNGKSAIEWVMERYQVSTDKDSGIKNDPNDWCREHNDPAYILNLVKRVIRVSMETSQIVCSLPPIE